jgi:hypothetical protein
MGTMIVIVFVSTGLNLALWAALYLRVDGLPLRIWSMAKKERAESDTRSATALQEAAAGKVGAIVNALRAYQEEVAKAYRAQIGEADLRTRICERRSSEAGVALSAATVLVRELRAILDRVGLPAEKADGARLSEDELTCVATRPVLGEMGAASGLVAPSGKQGAS